MKIGYALALLALSACDSKPAFEGVCIEEKTDGTPDSCWLDTPKANCKGKFVEQASRDKGELYCTMEGFKGDAKNGVLHRKKTEK